MRIVKKKRRICIPQNFNIDRSWNIIAPVIAQEIGVPDYTPIPYYFDTNAFQIGHIFVPTSTEVTRNLIEMNFSQVIPSAVSPTK